MARGGKRPGAGRKPGAVTKLTRKFADAAAASGDVLPLDVMLTAMREHYAAGRLDEAAKVAEKAAPYMHAKLAAVEHSGNLNVSHESWLDELDG